MSSHAACARCRARSVRKEVALRAIEFEREVLGSLGLSKNSKTVTGNCGTRPGRAIPDGIRRSDLIEVKSGTRVTFTRQLRILLSSADSTGMRLYLVVSPRTSSISYSLSQAINRTGGLVLVFDPDTSKFSGWWDRVSALRTTQKTATPR